MLQHFKALDLDSHVSWEEVRNAYKDLIRVWHPDRFEGDPELQARAEKKTKEINLSYYELKKHFASLTGAGEACGAEQKMANSDSAKPSSENPKNEWARAEKRRAARKEKRSRRSKYSGYQSPSHCSSKGTAATVRTIFTTTFQTITLLVSPGFLLSIWLFVIVIARPSPERVSSFVKTQSSYMSERIISTLRVLSQRKGKDL